MWKSRTDRPLRRARNEISRHEDQQTRRKRSHQFTRWIQAQRTQHAGAATPNITDTGHFPARHACSSSIFLR